MLNEEKLKRLVQVSKLYYEENRTQAEIAKKFQISRPMVSKLLTEARERGIVTIHITEATSYHQILAERLAERFSVGRAVVIPMERNEERTDGAVVKASLKVLAEKLSSRGNRGCVGIGWGSLLGRAADFLEMGEFSSRGPEISGVVCPLIGNAAASYRSYHPNELVRIAAKHTGLTPAYIYGPAIAESEGEKEVYRNTDSYRQVKELWQQLDAALVNVSNYPSSPDMATALRFGTRLAEEKAVGHILSYFYDGQGRLIAEEKDRLLRISVEELRRAASVIALCGSGVKAVSAAGALRCGLITDIVLNEELAAELLQE